MNIGFISTRFSGTDGVSLESQKWADVLHDLGHSNFWFAGKLDRDESISYCIPEAHFAHPENEWINQQIWGKFKRSALVGKRIKALSEYLKARIHDFVNHYQIDLIIAQNVLTIPMHVPLGIALTQFMAENRIPVVAHHHDFYWERDRFQVNSIPDYLDMAFPPRDVDITHVVINSAAKESLTHRKGVSCTLIPNVIHFEAPSPGIDDYNKDVRKDLGYDEEDIIFLQPTRVVPRKGIEHAIKLIQLLDNPKCKLLITHEAGDEGTEYLDMLYELAVQSNVDMRIVDTRVSEKRQLNDNGQKIYTLWDIYPHANFVTYPSLYEGFGNAFLEAIYFKLPVLVNRYSIYIKDIEPKGFKVVSMEGILTNKIVKQVREILENKEMTNQIVEHNFKIASKYYGYAMLKRKLSDIISSIEGEMEVIV